MKHNGHLLILFRVLVYCCTCIDLHLQSFAVVTSVSSGTELVLSVLVSLVYIGIVLSFFDDSDTTSSRNGVATCGAPCNTTTQPFGSCPTQEKETVSAAICQPVTTRDCELWIKQGNERDPERADTIPDEETQRRKEGSR